MFEREPPHQTLLSSEAAGAALAHHGGNLSAAQRRFPDAPKLWVDLSTGINPHAYPIGDLPAELWTRLPDACRFSRLEDAAARRYGVGPTSSVVAAAGTQALIQQLPRALPADRVAVLGFGYQEHPAVWRRAGADVTIVRSLADLVTADIAIVVNPNNPDGRVVAPGDLVDVAARMDKHGGTLVVDEAFVDTMPVDASLVPRLPANAIVLRSFGKMFGLAGLRLGFAVSSQAVAARLRAEIGPWAVSGPAAAIGTRALADTAWLERMIRKLDIDAARLDSLLDRSGFRLIGGTSLFRLVERADAVGWFCRLGQAGILVRPFATHPTWLRFGLPADAEAWARLEVALRS